MARTILVVDDQDELRLLISLTLQSLGHIIEASSASQARQLALAERPDLIVLDVWLGDGENGLDVCAALKRDPATSATRVVLLSAYGQQSDITAGREAGADLYIVKPFSPLELFEAVSSLLASMTADTRIS